jgi:hypothetical protein
VIISSLELGHQMTVLVCGPGNMSDEATRQIVKCVKEGFKVDLVEEAYAWLFFSFVTLLKHMSK